MADLKEPIDILKEDLPNLLAKTEEEVIPEKRQEFAIQVGLVLKAYVEELAKEVHLHTNGGWGKIVADWHELPAKIEMIVRRRELENPRSQQDFEATLMWMAERGEAEDLELIRKVREVPSYSSQGIDELFEIAEKRISERIDNPELEEEDEHLVSGTDIQQASWAAFQQQLPHLLKQALGQWVAFHGEHYVLGASKREVYGELKRKQWPRNEVVVRRIAPLGPPIDTRTYRGVRAQRRR